MPSESSGISGTVWCWQIRSSSTGTGARTWTADMSVREVHLMSCPNCDTDDQIHIRATATVLLLASGGFERINDSMGWDHDSTAYCGRCKYAATVGDFIID